MTRKKKQLEQQVEQEQEHEQEQEQIVCVRCKGLWYITEFDTVIDKNPMCVVCSTIIGGTNQ